MASNKYKIKVNGNYAEKDRNIQKIIISNIINSLQSTYMQKDFIGIQLFINIFSI